VGLAATLALLIGFPSVPASAVTSVTAFTIDTQPDGNGGSGISHTFTPTNATVTASIDGGDGVQMTATSAGNVVYTAIIRPPTGQTLAPGPYTTTRDGDAVSAGLNLSIGGSAACGDSTGTLTILEVTLGVSTVDAFAATYSDKTCAAYSWLAFGELRYQSTFEFKAASTSPAMIDFDSQPVARTSAPTTVTVTNDGTQDVTFGTVGLSGTNAAAFTVQDDLDLCSLATVAPAQTCTMGVTFHPDAAGGANAQLDLPDDTARGARNVPLTGTGTILTTQVTLKTSAKSVSFGKSVKVTAHLADHLDTTSKELSIYATPYGGAKKLIASGDVNGDGNLSVTYTPTKKTTFGATFAGDATYQSASSATKIVGVAVRISGTLTHFDSRSGKFRIYDYTANCPKHHRGCPTYAVKVAPNHAGKQVMFVLQLYSSGAWRTALSVGGRLGPRSTRVEIFIYRNASVVGLPTRVHVRFGGDADHLGRTSPWSYFKVV
jgi:hypothetical protein